MRFLLAPVGTEGDVRPMAALGCVLRDAGHDVLFGASPDYRGEIETLGLRFAEVGLNTRNFFLTNPGMMKGRPWAALATMFREFDRFAGAQFDGMLQYARNAEWIVGAGLMFAGSSVALNLGIRYDHAIHVPAVLPNADYPPVTIAAGNLPRFLNRMLWHVNRFVLAAALGPSFNRHRVRIGLAPVRDLQALLLRKVVLAMDPTLGPIPSEVTAEVQVTGYWQLLDSEPLPANVERFLDSGAPPLYAGFGSMGSDRPAATLRLLAGSACDAGVRLVVAGGWAGLDSGDLPPNVCLVKHAPHHALLPRVAGAVHHGGAGTTWACARAGIPQCAVPHLLDQHYWGERIRRLGIGPAPVSRPRLTRRKLALIFSELLSGRQYRTRARELSLDLSARNGLAEATALFS